VSSISGLLYSLRDLAALEETWSGTVKALAVPNGPLEQFQSTLEQLIEKLLPVVRLKKVGKTMTWPFRKGEIKDILCKIERQKMLFALALQNDNT
jgi:hypothetical protein